ncbi:MAG: TPM domain-containing protein [Candidatus Omnitrophica bacterium]|nr:TPM domain-containing protein [Candidatus Omnitrophota bacterium]
MVNLLDKNARQEIVEAIRRAESRTSGEIRVHVAKKCGEDVLGRARKIFMKLGMHRTKQRNGVLIFVALDSRFFAIVGDSGIHHAVGDSFWSGVRDKMAECFRKGGIREGILAGVAGVGEKLERYFPVGSADRNELPDTVTGG